MKKVLSILVAGIAIFTFAFCPPAFAGDAASGAKIFAANCNACHMGGNNVVNGAKTLKGDALEKYGMNSIEKITYQVIHGKNAMPAFAGRLTEKQIDDVATYVLDKSEKGW